MVRWAEDCEDGSRLSLKRRCNYRKHFNLSLYSVTVWREKFPTLGKFGAFAFVNFLARQGVWCEFKYWSIIA